MSNLNHHTNLIKTLNTRARERGVYLVCRLQEKRSKRVEAVGQKINEVGTAKMKGIGLHLFNQKGQSVLTSTDDLENEDGVKATLEQAIDSIVTLSPCRGKESDSLRRKESDSGESPRRTSGLQNDILSEARTRNLEIFSLKPQKDQINLAKNFDFNALTTTEIENRLLRLNQKIKETGHKAGVGDNLRIISSVSIGQEAWRIARSDSTDITWELPKAVIATRLTYEKNSKKADDYLSQFSPGWGIFTNPQKQKEYLQEASFVIALLKKSIDAPEYPAGSYPILIDSKLGGLLAHEAFGHAAESDSIYNNTSVLGKNGKLRQGARVANSIVSIIDETVPGTCGYSPYSAFGVPREKVEIVKNGILQASLGDTFSGIKIGDRSRGASRIENYGDIPLPRMSRTYISVDISKSEAQNPKHKTNPNYQNPNDQNGNMFGTFEHSNLEFVSNFDIQISDFASQIRNSTNIDRVLVLHRGRGGGQVDPRTGTFMFGFAYLYEITPDSIKLFRGSSFSGQTLEALKAIKAGFGKINTSHIGTCGKGNQLVPENAGSNEFLFIDKTPYVTIGGS